MLVTTYSFVFYKRDTEVAEKFSGLPKIVQRISGRVDTGS